MDNEKDQHYMDEEIKANPFASKKGSGNTKAKYH